VGSQQAFNQYVSNQQLDIAHEQQMAIQDYYDAAWDWAAWGSWGPLGPLYGPGVGSPNHWQLDGEGHSGERPSVMPFEARDTLRLQLAGKIDQWFAKTDGSGAVFLMNVTDPAEARAWLEELPLGRAGMMTFQYIPMGPLWPLGLLLREPG
jgi:hypothetical protein